MGVLDLAAGAAAVRLLDQAEQDAVTDAAAGVVVGVMARMGRAHERGPESAREVEPQGAHKESAGEAEVGAAESGAGSAPSRPPKKYPRKSERREQQELADQRRREELETGRALQKTQRAERASDLGRRAVAVAPAPQKAQHLAKTPQATPATVKKSADTVAFPVDDPKGKGAASPVGGAPLQRVDGSTGVRALSPGEFLTLAGQKTPLPQGPLRYPRSPPPKDGKENINPIDSGGSSGKRKASPDKGPAAPRAIQDAPSGIDAPWPKMQMLHALQFTPGAC